MNHETEGSNDADTAGAATAAPSGHGGGPRRASSWFKRIGGLAVFAMIAGLALGPSLIARWLRGEIERQGTARVHGRVSVESVQLFHNGKAILREVVVEDEDGEQVARVPEIRVDVGLRSLLTGKKDVSAVIEEADLELVRGEDGRWNLQDLLVATDDETSDESGDDSPGQIPRIELEGRIEIVNATVAVRSPDTMLQLNEVAVGVGLDGVKRGLTLASSAVVFGGTGSAGNISLEAVIWPKAGPGARLDELKVEGLDLGVVQEAMLLVGSPLEAGSTLAGTLALNASGTLADLDAEAAFELSLDANMENLVVDLRSEGLKAIEFDDPSARASLRASRAERGAEPTVTAEVRGRGDRLRADVRWDGAADVGLTADVRVDALSSKAGIEPLLARLHPVFAGARAIQGAAVDATVTSAMDITYEAPLSLAQLAGGWAALPKEPFRGTGSLSVDEGLVEASPFFQEILAALDQPTNPTFDLKPLGFAIDAGRIAYTNPWTWTIQGTETRFAGSVGLDASLDLRWVVPMSGGLARRNRVFEALAGETLEVGLGGTLTSPTFNVAGALASLTRRVAERKLREELDGQKETLKKKLEKEVERAIGGKVPGGIPGGVIPGDAGKILDEVLGGKVPTKPIEETVKSLEDAAKKALGGGQDAASMLQEADRLWGEGKKSDAGALYSRIRKEFPLSPTYLLNKKRIKSRRNG